jgi:general secretion pathway protein J
LQLFSIDLDKEDDKQVIKVTITPFFAKQGDVENKKESVVLLRGISDFSMAYFGVDDGMDSSLNSGSWHDEWLEKTTQPRLVKITIKRDDDSFWPEMLIALKVTGKFDVQNQNQDPNITQ